MPPKTKPTAETKGLLASPRTGSAKTVFYARVSTRDQKADLQLDAARRLGIPSQHIFVEKASGLRHDRPVLEKALAAISKGDTLAAYKLDRIGRSLVHVTKLLADLEARGVHFRTVEDGLSTQGSTSSSCMCSAPWLNSSGISSWSAPRLAWRQPRSAGSV